jgi:ubiquinol oxidase
MEFRAALRHTAVGGWPKFPGEPMIHESLRLELGRTLAQPRMRYGPLASALFLFMDLVYGKKRSLSKFKVLETIARVPYQAWESVAYVAITRKFRQPGLARRIFEFVHEARAQQDNEQWHLLIMEELVEESGAKEGFLRHRLLPQLAALFYYHASWILYAIRPAYSYRLNAQLEDHAEHEYMEYVGEHPELENRPYDGAFKNEYGSFPTRSELFIRIGLDERRHKEESLGHLEPSAAPPP